MARPPKPKRNPLDPPGFDWRGGRPIWIPQPRLRAAGWVSIALKDEAGAYLPLGRARLMARAIAEDVARWRAGEAVRIYGPVGELSQAALTARQRAGERTLEAAYNRWISHRRFRALSTQTRRVYRADLRRFLERFGGEHPALVDRATLSEWFEAEWDRVFAQRACGWTPQRWEKAPRRRAPSGASWVPEIRERRDEAVAERLGNVPGQAQMNSIIRGVSALYSFIVGELGWIEEAQHPARRFGLRALRPRLRLPGDAEFAHLAETADALGHRGLADALILLAHTGQRPSDLIELETEIFETGRVRLTQSKTGGEADARLSAIAQARVDAIKARRAERLEKTPEAARPAQLLLTDARAVPWTLTHLQDVMAEVRAVAAAGDAKREIPAMPSVADLTLYDFRRKCVTRLSEAGATPQMIAAITRHSLKTIMTILKHYSVSTVELADRTMDELDAHLQAKGVKW